MAARPPKVLTVGANAVVCQEADIFGHVTIGSGSVIHPKCTILAEDGPIIIGKDNILEEQCVIHNCGGTGAGPMILGDCNVLEVGSRVKCKSMGNRCVVEAKAHVHKGVVLHSDVVVGAKIEVPEGEDVPDGTVLFGATREHNQMGTFSQEAHTQLLARHLEILRKTLPHFHHTQKSTR